MISRWSGRRRLLAVGGVLLALVAGAVVFLIWAFEVVEEEVEVGFRGPARWNRYFAAERLIGELGYDVTTVLGEPGDLPVDHAVLFVAPRRTPNQQLAGRLLEWVATGGLLIAAPAEIDSGFAGAPAEDGEGNGDGPEGSTEDGDGVVGPDMAGRAWGDPWLEAFEVTLAPRASDRLRVVEVEVGSGSPVLKVELPHAPLLRATASRAASWATPDPDGAFVLRYTHGSGEVILLSEAGFLDNEHIGDHDHATILADLLESEPAISGVSIVIFDTAPSFLALVLRQGWVPLLSAAVALLAWIAAAGRRFGPLLPEPALDRRSLVEHIEATSEFLWRHGQTEALAESVRHRIRTRLTLLQPAWTELPRRDLVQQLAEATGLPAVRIDRALHDAAPADPARFQKTILTLETLRKAL